MIEFRKKVQAQFNKMCATGKLFRIALSGSEVWTLYLGSFKDDPKFRDPASSFHNCNLCHNFIRRYGNIVAVDKDYGLMSLFDVETEGEYAEASSIMSKAVKGSVIQDAFFETAEELKKLGYAPFDNGAATHRIGMAVNHKRYTKEEAEKFGVVKPNEIRTFNHLCLDLAKAFVPVTSASIESIQGEYRDAKNVFKRAMDEISIDTLQLVRDLINQGSLLDGTTHLYKIEQFIPYMESYTKLGANQKNNWAWVTSYKLPFAKFRNELIGVLCSELSEGKEINEAAQAWNKRVDPANYMKVSAPITKKQIEEAKKFVEEGGYIESFTRRFATIEDIKVDEIKHINIGNGEVKTASIFDGLSKSTPSRHKRNEFEGVEEVNIDKFMKDILPTCTSVEAYLDNSHEGNLVSLTTAIKPDSKPIFKWDNNYSWTFKGNLAGKSQIKEAVKTQGGKVDGVLRFSIMWAEDSVDDSDLDAHCVESNGEEIYFGHKASRTGGTLDIDIIHPQDHKVRTKQEVVENITYPSKTMMKDGKYDFFVVQFNGRQSKGFKAEIEFDGQIYSYVYTKPVGGSVRVAVVTLDKGVFSIKHGLPETESSKTIYGLETNEFHKVSLVSLSPNHWGKNNVGNKHYLFMIDGCKPDTGIRSFHNENLIPDLLAHRKVMDVLGSTSVIQPTGKQLSGLGFNATVRDELIVRLSGSFKRVVKVKF